MEAHWTQSCRFVHFRQVRQVRGAGCSQDRAQALYVPQFARGREEHDSMTRTAEILANTYHHHFQPGGTVSVMVWFVSFHRVKASSLWAGEEQGRPVFSTGTNYTPHPQSLESPNAPVSPLGCVTSDRLQLRLIHTLSHTHWKWML